MATKLKPAGVIIADFGLEPNGPVHYYFAQRCKDRMNARYVPVGDTKLLSQSSIVDRTDCSIIYYQRYAGYQYYGQRKDGTHKVKKYSKPGTGPFWDKKMVSAESGELLRDVKNYIKERGKK